MEKVKQYLIEFDGRLDRGEARWWEYAAPFGIGAYIAYVLIINGIM